MKKAMVVFVAMLILCISMAVVATDTFITDINVTLPDENNAVIVSGTTAMTRENTMLILRFVNSMGDDIYIDYTETEKKDGVVVYTFPAFNIPSNLTSGVYKFIISGEDESGNARYIEETWEYNGSDRKLKVLDLIQSTKGTENTIAGVLSSYFDDGGEIPITKLLSISDFSTYEKFGEKGKAAFEWAITDEILTEIFEALPQKTVTGEKVVDLEAFAEKANIEKIDNALAIFLKAYNDAIAIGSFAEIGINPEFTFDKWYNDYYEKDGYDFDSETELTKIVNKAKTEADFLNRIKGKTEPMVIKGKDGIQGFIYESSLLSTIATKSNKVGTIQELLFDFSDPGEYFENFKKQEFEDLSLMKQEKALSEFIHISYPTIPAAISTINGKITGDGDKEETNGSSGSKGGGFGKVSFPVADEKEEVTEEKELFSDLKDVEWAKSAIEYLAKRGVVNGKASGIYAPNDNITRAEFVKIVVAAMGIEISDTDNTFTDVDASAWYAPYVAAAQKRGIVNGDDRSGFYPDAPITREDMVTILYRVIGATQGGELDFADASSISDYARDAVGYFANQGIVNGIGEGNFAPKNNATRAETAVIIYRIINNQ